MDIYFFISEFTDVVDNACYEQMKVLIQKNMDKIKKSILYDIRKGFEELQNNLLLNLSRQEEINPISALKQTIGIKLPTSTLDEFNNLDLLMDQDEKKNALVNNLKTFQILKTFFFNFFTIIFINILKNY